MRHNYMVIIRRKNRIVAIRKFWMQSSTNNFAMREIQKYQFWYMHGRYNTPELYVEVYEHAPTVVEEWELIRHWGGYNFLNDLLAGMPVGEGVLT